MEKAVMNITPKERIFLSAIRKRPGMYLGAFSLSLLRSFIDGYRGALINNGMEDQVCILPGEFHNYAVQRCGLDYSGMGYDTAILQVMPDGREAIERFFELLDEFLEENGFEKLPELISRNPG